MSTLGPELLGPILDRHGGPLVLYARQWCASPEDVVQDALMHLMRQPELPKNVVGWLYRVVRNGAINASRSAARRAKREAAAARGEAWFDVSPGQGLDAADATAALERLPIELRGHCRPALGWTVAGRGGRVDRFFDQHRPPPLPGGPGGLARKTRCSKMSRDEERELKSLEAQLAALRPRSDRLDRDRLMYLAGRESALSDGRRAGGEGDSPIFASPLRGGPAKIGTVPLRRLAGRAARWAWPSMTAAMTAVSAVLAVLLFTRPNVPQIVTEPAAPGGDQIVKAAPKAACVRADRRFARQRFSWPGTLRPPGGDAFGAAAAAGS